jgi:hypothetical protein
MGCEVDGWSAVSSATANAALAGILAGFMLNGVAVLLGRTEKGPRFIQALTLLFAAFVALSLDAYLWGLVTGEGRAAPCGRGWTEAMFAAGPLAIGAVAIIAGFTLLFDIYVKSEKSQDKPTSESIRLLGNLLNALRGGVTIVALTLLYMTSRNYIYAVLGAGVSSWAKNFLIAYLVIAILSTIAIVGWGFIRSRQANDRLQRQSQADAKQEKKPEEVSDEAERESFRRLKYAMYFSVAYSVGSVIFASIAASSSARHWNPAHFEVRIIVLLATVWVLVVSLIPIGFLIRTVPSFEPPRIGTGGTGAGAEGAGPDPCHGPPACDPVDRDQGWLLTRPEAASAGERMCLPFHLNFTWIVLVKE